LIFFLTNLEFDLYTIKIKAFGGGEKDGWGKKLMNPKKKLIWAGFICILSFCSLSVAQESAWFCHPYGAIEYWGDPAPDGLKVVAFIEGQEFASCLTKDGEYDLLIPKDDPVTSKKEGWSSEEDLITIKVSGFTANPKFKAFAGAQQMKLYVSTLDVPPTTWGKIKALFR
jgi:hypothetical protein